MQELAVELEDELNFIFYYWDCLLSMISFWYALLNLNWRLFLVSDHNLMFCSSLCSVISLILIDGITLFIVILSRSGTRPLFLLSPANLIISSSSATLPNYSFDHQSRSLLFKHAR